jgi:hypothetical protein
MCPYPRCGPTRRAACTPLSRGRRAASCRRSTTPSHPCPASRWPTRRQVRQRCLLLGAAPPWLPRPGSPWTPGSSAGRPHAVGPFPPCAAAANLPAVGPKAAPGAAGSSPDQLASLTLSKAESAEKAALEAQQRAEGVEAQLAAASDQMEARLAAALEAADLAALRAQVQALAQQGRASGAAEEQLRRLEQQQVRSSAGVRRQQLRRPAHPGCADLRLAAHSRPALVHRRASRPACRSSTLRWRRWAPRCSSRRRRWGWRSRRSTSRTSCGAGRRRQRQRRLSRRRSSSSSSSSCR